MTTCVVLALSACSDDAGSAGCSDVGASSSVRVDLAPSLVGEGLLHVDLCHAEVCEQVSVWPADATTQDVGLDVGVTPPATEGSTLRVQLRPSTGQVLAAATEPVTFRDRHPNGPDCGSQPVVVADPISLEGTASPPDGE